MRPRSKPQGPLGLYSAAIPAHRAAGPPTVGHDVWIADGAVVMGGVHVGDGAVVGAHAVVTRDVPPYAVVVGNPARVVKHRFDAGTVARFVAARWWDLPDAAIRARLAPLLGDPPAFLAAAERLRAEADNDAAALTEST